MKQGTTAATCGVRGPLRAQSFRTKRSIECDWRQWFWNTLGSMQKSGAILHAGWVFFFLPTPAAAKRGGEPVPAAFLEVLKVQWPAFAVRPMRRSLPTDRRTTVFYRKICSWRTRGRTRQALKNRAQDLRTRPIQCQPATEYGRGGMVETIQNVFC